MNKKRQNAYLGVKQIEKLKDVLLAEKERLCNKNLEDERYCLDKNELSDVLDEASINIQTSTELRFRNRDIFYLKKINKSLQAIEDETYGLCEDCDAHIGFDRLLARPTAELCILCKEESEFTESSNIHMKKSKSLGKTIAEL
jgi:DnaK suppressor protein